MYLRMIINRLSRPSRFNFHERESTGIKSDIRTAISFSFTSCG